MNLILKLSKFQENLILLWIILIYMQEIPNIFQAAEVAQVVKDSFFQANSILKNMNEFEHMINSSEN